jgi:type VI secretion system protein ImpF
MTHVFQNDRLQPSLLDRLSDDNPRKEHESREQRTISLEKYTQSVLRDLEWLLNTGCLGAIQDLNGYPEVKKSVLNLGVPDYAGQTSSSLTSVALERVIRQAILDFEPRILAKSLKVRIAERGRNNSVVFRIEGELWWQPMPEHLYLTTVLDLELGKIEVKSSG